MKQIKEEKTYRRIPLQDVAIMNRGDKEELVLELAKMQEAFAKMSKVCENIRKKLRNE